MGRRREADGWVCVSGAMWAGAARCGEVVDNAE